MTDKELKNSLEAAIAKACLNLRRRNQDKKIDAMESFLMAEKEYLEGASPLLKIYLAEHPKKSDVAIEMLSTYLDNLRGGVYNPSPKE